MSKVLDTSPVTYRLRNMKDKYIICGFHKYELRKVKNTGTYQI